MGDTALTADDLARLRSAVEQSTDGDHIPASDVLALLDMVDGLQQLVRMLVVGPGEPGHVIVIPPDDPERESIVHLADGWVTLRDHAPDLAALLDQALTPQGDEEG